MFVYFQVYNGAGLRTAYVGGTLVKDTSPPVKGEVIETSKGGLKDIDFQVCTFIFLIILKNADILIDILLI